MAGQIGLERTPGDYVAGLVEVFRLVRDLLAEQGTLWLNLGDCYATGAGTVGECPGGGVQGDRWKGYRGTRPGSAKHASGAMGPMTQPNRLPLPGLKPKDLVGIPWRVAFALQSDGWTLRSDIIWHKPNCMPESVKDRPTRAYEYLFLFSKSKRYYYNHAAIRESASYGDHVRNMDSPYCVPGQPAHRGLRKQGLSKSGNTSRWYGEDYGRPGAHRGASVPWEGDHRNKRSVWSVSSRPCLDAHFATFPPELNRTVHPGRITAGRHRAGPLPRQRDHGGGGSAARPRVDRDRPQSQLHAHAATSHRTDGVGARPIDGERRRVEMNPLSLQRAALFLVASMGPALAADTARIEVFTTAGTPVTGVSARAVRVYTLDTPALIEAEINAELPRDPSTAHRYAQRALKRQWREAAERLTQAYRGLLKGSQYGLEKLPAIVFDGRAVVYGITDLDEALGDYRRWKARSP